MLLFTEIRSQSVSRKNSTAIVNMNRHPEVGEIYSNIQRGRGSHGKWLDCLLNCAWLSYAWPIGVGCDWRY